ncbi:MAG: HisA/HisF-related TIM barrel protein [Paracoccaceae bacterium]
MILFPTLELLNGKPVSLRQGRLDEAEIWHIDPVALVRSWAEDGADWMHLTNFDWITNGAGSEDLVQQILRVAGIPVQLAGGFRTADGVADWIDRGAGRIVVSTLALQDPDTVKALARAYPDQIVLSVDVRKGRVMCEGWRTESAFRPVDFLREFNQAPLAGVIVTDIDSDLRDRDAQLGVVSGLAAAARAPVVASGVVHCLDDVARLKYVPNIAGALVGRALMRKSIDLRVALDLAASTPETVADFI